MNSATLPATAFAVRAPAIPHLTGLRGLAALIVFVAHAANLGYLPKVMGKGFGQVGVILFFGLSGFLMAYVYSGRRPDKPALKGFIAARAGRVLPLYLLVVLFSFVISGLLAFQFRYPITSPKSLLFHMLFIHGLNELWTIPIEVHYYVFFLLVWLVLGSSRDWKRPAVNCLTVVLVASMLCALTGLATGEFTRVLPFYVLPFLLGQFLGYVAVRGTFFERLDRSNWAANAFAMLLLVAFVLNLPVLRADLGLVTRTGAFWSTWADPITLSLCLGIVACAALGVRAYDFMKSRLAVFMGSISYGFYLIHRPAMDTVERVARNLKLEWGGASIFVALIASVVLATASLHLIEKPCNRWIRSRVRPSPSAEAPVRDTPRLRPLTAVFLSRAASGGARTGLRTPPVKLPVDERRGARSPHAPASRHRF